MKLIRLLILMCALMPICAPAQTTKVTVTTINANDQYPLFDTKEAAQYWHKWIVKETFTQADFARVIDLCNTAYDYLNSDINTILDAFPTHEGRQRGVLTLDTGKTSEMSNFVRSFSNSLQNLAASGQFDQENVQRVIEMIKKKSEYKRLFDILYHS